MDKSQLGTKRLCAECALRFFDLNHDPIHCPKCQAVFVVPILPTRPPRYPRAFQPFGQARPEPLAAEDSVDSEADAVSDDKDDESSAALLLDDDDELEEQKADVVETIDTAQDERDT